MLPIRTCNLIKLRGLILNLFCMVMMYTIWTYNVRLGYNVYFRNSQTTSCSWRKRCRVLIDTIQTRHGLPKLAAKFGRKKLPQIASGRTYKRPNVFYPEWNTKSVSEQSIRCKNQLGKDRKRSILKNLCAFFLSFFWALYLSSTEVGFADEEVLSSVSFHRLEGELEAGRRSEAHIQQVDLSEVPIFLEFFRVYYVIVSDLGCTNDLQWFSSGDKD